MQLPVHQTAKSGANQPPAGFTISSPQRTPWVARTPAFCWMDPWGTGAGREGSGEPRQHWGTVELVWGSGLQGATYPLAFRASPTPRGLCSSAGRHSGEGWTGRPEHHYKVSTQLTCPLFLDLTLTAASSVLLPRYLFRTLSLPGRILTTRNGSVGKKMPDIKLIRKRWGGMLQTLFMTYKGRIKMLIIFLRALHMTFQINLGLRFSVTVSPAPTHSVHIWYFKSPSEKRALMWLAQPRQSSSVNHYWIVHNQYSENMPVLQENVNSWLMSDISQQHPPSSVN